MNATDTFLNNVLEYMPNDWLKLTTHRLDIYNEELAKVEFLEKFEALATADPKVLKENLANLPTAFDYIRLGHPLSCVLEWSTAKSLQTNVDNVISFSSVMMPLMAILRKNLLTNIKTQILYKGELPKCFDTEVLNSVYNYHFELVQWSEDIPSFDGSTVFVHAGTEAIELNDKIDFIINLYPEMGSVVIVNGSNKDSYISEILHVRRRESIAMTPNDCLAVLKNESAVQLDKAKKEFTIETIKNITNSNNDALLGNCGLSMQYSITMGLIEDALVNHKGKDIKLIVPPNCYGGTNDQARRVAACIDNVEIMDLPVDSGQDMVQSVEKVLTKVAELDAVALIIAEIPTNPRVEVPHLEKLKEALIKTRKTPSGDDYVAPVFILDQTFCPNVKFLGEGDIFNRVKTISYVSGSKFPSGGLCTAGYCVANDTAKDLMKYIGKHLEITDNKATGFQVEILSEQMPSMIERIDGAYTNTRGFVNHIQEKLPNAKINFVSEELALAGFTPSVFSLDLPTVGNTADEKETYKRELNHKLIKMMIDEIPSESKHCVSYGQLKGCYWTIPATSTQGTTKEGDKDYIVRVALSPEFDLDKHKEVFTAFCEKFHLLEI